jgi:hypothetical protein
VENSKTADLEVGATLMASAANAAQRSTTTPDLFHGMTLKKPLQRPATTSR